MSRMVGTVSRGVRAPIIRAGDDLAEIVTSSVLEAAADDGFAVRDRDIVAMTEAIVARAQGNYASVDNIAEDVRTKFGGETIGVIFPILSRNRFAICLRGIAKGAKKIVLMLSYPSDEVGNHLVSLDALDEKGVDPYKDVLTEAKYRNMDLFPIYEEFAKKYADTGYTRNLDDNWMNNFFACSQKVKFDLFNRYGVIAAAGDRHLAEFCEGKWYLKDPETVRSWGFGLTPVSWRKADLKERLKKSEDYRSGAQKVQIRGTGEEGVQQIRAILGLRELVTNVNMPNVGQMPNMPLGAVVETNAAFRADEVKPVMAGPVPQSIYPLVARICGEQEVLNDAIARRDVEAIFNAFANDPLVTCSRDEAHELFKEMVLNTKKYLASYDLSKL